MEITMLIHGARPLRTSRRAGWRGVLCGIVLTALAQVAVPSAVADALGGPSAPERCAGLAELLADFRARQLQSIELVPPPAEHIVFDQGVRLIDPAGFDEGFLASLRAERKYGVAVYPLLVFEDARTREVVLADESNTAILVVRDRAYDPLWLLYEKREELRQTVRTDDEFLALAQRYDPSRVGVRYELLLDRDLDVYLAAQRPADLDIPIVTMSMGDPPTEIYFTAITRDSSYMELAIAYPTNVASLDVFSVDGGVGLIDFWWNLRDTISLSGSTNDMSWTDASASLATIRFYAVANADTNSSTDPDGDGLTWGREHYLHHTCPTNADTDGDGIDDDVEVLTNNTDPNNDDTTAPSVAIDTPAEGFNWVWLP